MKHISTITLSAILAAALALCAWLGILVYRYSGRPSYLYPPFHPLLKVQVQYPINGLTEAELKTVLATFYALPEDEREGGILSVETHGDSCVVIQTGTIRGGLDGGGRYLVFNKISDGWIHNEQHNWGWES